MIEARLPAHYAPETIDVERHTPWLVAGLLEEGDSRDLRWLLETVGREPLENWVAARGARQLSGRSLAFWRLVLDVESVGEPRGEALWLR